MAITALHHTPTNYAKEAETLFPAWDNQVTYKATRSRVTILNLS